MVELVYTFNEYPTLNGHKPQSLYPARAACAGSSEQVRENKMSVWL